MATTFAIVIAGHERDYARQASAAAFRELDRLENELSRYVESSDIARANRLARGQTIPIGDDALHCLLLAADASLATDRAFDEMVVHNRRSAKSHTGIWRDLAIRKRKTEVDAQILPIVEVGRKLGVPTPLTARTVEMIHEIEDGKRQLVLGNLDELAERTVIVTGAAHGFG
eukprot:gene55709-76352_t